MASENASVAGFLVAIIVVVTVLYFIFRPSVSKPVGSVPPGCTSIGNILSNQLGTLLPGAANLAFTNAGPINIGPISAFPPITITSSPLQMGSPLAFDPAASYVCPSQNLLVVSAPVTLTMPNANIQLFAPVAFPTLSTTGTLTVQLSTADPKNLKVTSASVSPVAFSGTGDAAALGAIALANQFAVGPTTSYLNNSVLSKLVGRTISV